MDEPPDFDFIEDEDDFEELCREELMHMADHEMAMEMDSDNVGEQSSSLSSSSLSAAAAAAAPVVSEAPAPALYTSPHKMYQSPEVFKRLNNEFTKGKR
jgi:hypothetical protein